MTKDTKRERAKNPALNKRLNLKGRSEFIEPDYINGVYNEDGECVIRPMTEDEIEWLNQYYEESVAVNFWHDKRLKEFRNHPRYSELKKVNREVRKNPQIKELRSAIMNEDDDDRRDELLEIYELTREQLVDEMFDEELKDLHGKLLSTQKEVLLLKDDIQRKEVSDENNARNRCLYNLKKKMGILLDLDAYPDVFVGDNLDCKDPERIMIEKEDNTKSLK